MTSLTILHNIHTFDFTVWNRSLGYVAMLHLCLSHYGFTITCLCWQFYSGEHTFYLKVCDQTSSQ